jgi:large subunit ribosomal protein L15
MKLNSLPKVTAKPKKRVGRGYGSGKGGHTVGRGQKGQKVRGEMGALFEGTKHRKSLLKRLPLGRGKGKLKPGRKPLIVNLKYLNLLPAESAVDIESLAKAGIVNLTEAKKLGVKILGEGDLAVKLTVALPCSVQAAEKIVKAGGKVKK